MGSIRLDDNELLDVFHSGEDDEFDALNEDERGKLKSLIQASDSGRTLAQKRWGALKIAAADNTYPTSGGDKSMPGTATAFGENMADVAAPKRADGTRQFMRAPIPRLPVGPYGKPVNPLLRGAGNAVIGAANVPAGLADIARGTIETVGEHGANLAGVAGAHEATQESLNATMEAAKGVGKFVADIVASGGKYALRNAATMGGVTDALGLTPPQLDSVLSEHNITRDAFIEHLTNNPVETVMTIMPIIHGVPKVVNAVKGAVGPVEFSVGALPNEPKGPVVGTGLGGAQDTSLPKIEFTPKPHDPRFEGIFTNEVPETFTSKGVTFKQVGEQLNHKGEVRTRYWEADQELPFTGGTKGSRIPEGQLVREGYAPDVAEAVPREPAPPAWSNTAAILESLPDTIKAESLTNMLQKEGQRSGISLPKEEIAALQLDQLMEQNRGRKLTKEQVRDWVADRLVRVEERTLGSDDFATNVTNRAERLTNLPTEDITVEHLQRAGAEQGFIDEFVVSKTANVAKFDRPDLRLPGGENYREVLVKAPLAGEIKATVNPEGWGTTEGGTAGIEHPPGTYTGGHFDPNTLAHMRLTDRTVNVGGRDVPALFSEEFQSDWANARRRASNEIVPDAPDHPLLGQWKELLFKRFLRKAAEEGKEAVAWTTGEQQKARYNLEKHVGKILYENVEGKPGTERVRAYGPDGNLILDEAMPPEKIAETFGKGIADKLLAAPPDNPPGALKTTRTLRGTDLKVGGEWTTKLYDQQMVDVANKWARRYKGKVEDGVTSYKKGIDPDHPYRVDEYGVHTLRLTPEMRTSLLYEGNPTFGFLTKEGYQQTLQDLSSTWRRMGRTLGSNLGNMGELAEPIMKIGLYHANRLASTGLHSFDIWARDFKVSVAREVGPQGVALLDDATLKDIWNGPQVSAMRAAAMTDRTNKDTLDRSVVPGEDAALDTDAQTAAHMQAALGPGADWELAAQRMTSMAQEMGDSLGTTPQGLQLLHNAPELYKAGTHNAAAKGHAVTLANMHADQMGRIFRAGGRHLTTAREQLFIKFLNSEQVKGIKARNAQELAAYDEARAQVEQAKGLIEQEYQAYGKKLTAQQLRADLVEQLGEEVVKTVEEYKPSMDPTVPELTPAEEAAFKRDPAMAKALDYWLTKFQPFVEANTSEAGIKGRRVTPSGAYAPLLMIEEAKGTVSTIGGTPSDIRVSQFTPRRARSAKRASGVVPEGFHLNESLFDLMNYTLQDRLTAATRNRLRTEVSKYHRPDLKPGDMVEWNGKQVPIRQVDMLQGISKGLKVHKTLNVPEPVATWWHRITDPVKPSDTAIKMLLKGSRAITTAALLIPAEATMHALGVLSVYMGMPGVGHSLGTLGRGTAILGGPLGRTAMAMADIFSTHDAAFMIDVNTLAENATLRTSHFRGAMNHGDPNWLKRGYDKVVNSKHNPLRNVSGLRDWVFGYPSSKFPLSGVETRLRVASLRALRHMDPMITDAEACHLINNEMGTYVNQLVPSLANGLINFDPFARAGTALTKTGLKRLVGQGPQGLSYEVVASNLAQAYTIMQITKMNDPEGRWPWEIPGLPVGNIPYWDENGTRYEIPFRYLNNSLYRGMQLTGLKRVGEALLSGERDLDDLGEEWTRSMANFFLSRLGPGLRVAGALGPKQAPYYIKGWKPLPLDTEGSVNELGQAVGTPPFVNERLQAAANIILPAYAKIEEETGFPFKPDVFTDTLKGQSTTARMGKALGKALGFEIIKRPPDFEKRAMGTEPRGDIGDVYNRLDAIIFKAYSQENGMKWAREKIKEEFTDKKERGIALRSLMKRWRSAKIGAKRGVREAEKRGNTSWQELEGE